MDIDTKRMIVEKYCYTTRCKECKLVGREWENTYKYHNCLYIDEATEAELNKAIVLINPESKSVDPTNGRYWSRVCEMQKKQTEKGLTKYGQILEDNKDMTVKERLEYLQEELIDALMYIEHIKEILS